MKPFGLPNVRLKAQHHSSRRCRHLCPQSLCPQIHCLTRNSQFFLFFQKRPWQTEERQDDVGQRVLHVLHVPQPVVRGNPFHPIVVAEAGRDTWPYWS